MTTYTIIVYAGSTDRPHDPEVLMHRANQIRLGGVYGEMRQRYAVPVEVPSELLSAAARHMVELMAGDFTGGPVRASMPRLVVKRLRVGIARAAEVLGYPARAAAVWLDCYGDSVDEAVVTETLDNAELRLSMTTSALARDLNRLAMRAGLCVRTPAGTVEQVDGRAAVIDETKQVGRWEHLLKRGAAMVEGRG